MPPAPSTQIRQSPTFQTPLHKLTLPTHKTFLPQPPQAHFPGSQAHLPPSAPQLHFVLSTSAFSPPPTSTSLLPDLCSSAFSALTGASLPPATVFFGHDAHAHLPFSQPQMPSSDLQEQMVREEAGARGWASILVDILRMGSRI